MTSKIVRLEPRPQDLETIERARKDSIAAIIAAGAGHPTEGLPSVETAWRFLFIHGVRQ